MTFDEMKLQSQMLMMQMVEHVKVQMDQVSKLANETSRRQTEFELRTSKQFESVSDVVDTTSREIDSIKEQSQNAIDLATSAKHVQNIIETYVNQSDLGGHFKVNISNVRIGKILKIVGIAQKSKKTVPYFDKIPKYAKKTQTIDGYIHYKWNQKTCIEAIDQWLSKKNLLNDFYLIEHEDDMKTFIDDMFVKYVVLKGDI
jgi:hypothetical protein